MVFFVLDNSYHAQDVFIVLLKGTAEPLAWTVTPVTRWTIDRFGPGLEFRSVRDQMAHVAYEDAVYAWNEVSRQQPVRSFFPELAAALDAPGARPAVFDLGTGERFFLLDVRGAPPVPRAGQRGR